MARRPMLQKNKKSGFWYFRKRIPKQYIEVLGKKEECFSLNTQDKRVADKLVIEAEQQFNLIIEKAKRLF